MKETRKAKGGSNGGKKQNVCNEKDDRGGENHYVMK